MHLFSTLQGYQPRFCLECLLYLLRFRSNNLFFDLQFIFWYFFKIFIFPHNFIFLNHFIVLTSFVKFIYIIRRYYVCRKNEPSRVSIMRYKHFFNFWYLTLKPKYVNFSTVFLSKISIFLEIVALIIVLFGDFTTPLFL